jgi:hypothetical protein
MLADELMNPRGIARYKRKAIAPRVKDLNGGVIGLLDDSKDNANVFLDHVLKVLKKDFAFTDVLWIRKKSGSVPALFNEEFLNRCRFVVNAFGD